MTSLLVQSPSVPVTIHFPLTSMTVEEFDQFCLANQDLRIERTANGKVIIMPPAFSDASNRNFNIAVQLGSWASKDGTGLGFDSSAGFTLPNGAMRSPDASWISLSRWNALTDEQKASFAPICPDFVIELRSVRDRLNDLQEKMLEYLSNGILLGWLIDRQHRQVYIYRPNQDVEILDNPDMVKGDPELPGFVLQMAKIW